MEGDTLEWQALEFEHHEKGADWYWILGIFAATGALIAIVVDNILFAILIIIGALVVALYASKHPKQVHFMINRRGIQIDEVLHPFSSFESFWVDDTREDRPKLLITSKRLFSMQLVIPLGNVSHDNVRGYLIKHIHETPQGESIIERAMELIRF